MIQGKKVLAIIPARRNSKGLPQKNILPLKNKPLLGWPVSAALSSQYIDKVIVSTDDEKFAEIAKQEGAEVPFIRPAVYAQDESTSFSVIEHALQFFNSISDIFQYLVFLEPTSPLTEAADIDAALEKLLSNREIADSIVGVSEVISAHPLFDVCINDKGLIEPFINNEFGTFRRQEISKVYFVDGSLYVSDIPSLVHNKSFYHKRTLPFVVPKWKSFEIDDYIDFICIEAILNNLSKIRGNENEK